MLSHVLDTWLWCKQASHKYSHFLNWKDFVFVLPVICFLFDLSLLLRSFPYKYNGNLMSE